MAVFSAVGEFPFHEVDDDRREVGRIRIDELELLTGALQMIGHEATETGYQA